MKQTAPIYLPQRPVGIMVSCTNMLFNGSVDFHLSRSSPFASLPNNATADGVLAALLVEAVTNDATLPRPIAMQRISDAASKCQQLSMLEGKVAAAKRAGLPVSMASIEAEVQSFPLAPLLVLGPSFAAITSVEWDGMPVPVGGFTANSSTDVMITFRPQLLLPLHTSSTVTAALLAEDLKRVSGTHHSCAKCMLGCAGTHFLLQAPFHSTGLHLALQYTQHRSRGWVELWS